ncbi:MAG: glucose-6-phosphate isomerase [Clostridia bacterium]|nr:glucose-6-phosphate isomerase [Clostridia bacterium]MBQ1846982.1 glucose-6-phosphate isomerase [Clostridia bacterium]
MAISLKTGFCEGFVSGKDVELIKPEVIAARKTLEEGTGKGSDFTGWVRLPYNYDREEYARILEAAKRIQKDCDVFIVIGIGGSYLGARAAIEFVKSPLYNSLEKDTPDIYFAGNSISPTALSELLQICEGKDVCVNVISKSGTTTEPAVAFRIFRELLVNRYGKEEAVKRIYVTTDKARGALKKLADAEGCETFVVPDDIGGRYSVLTAVGLLPIAVAGIDTDEMLRGAYDAAEKFRGSDFEENDAMKYAAYRNILYRSGKTTEIMASYEAGYAMMNEWWKQLYGESEGKDGKGLFPASVIFSTDLHSLGQYIQDGRRNLFETVISFKTPTVDVEIPFDAENSDGLNFLAGKTLFEANAKAEAATILAHCDGGVPNLVLQFDKKDAYNFGYAVYFFEYACGISGYTLGVNPFDQPGVEAYKKNMYALLGKPGFEERAAELRARIGE